MPEAPTPERAADPTPEALEAIPEDGRAWMQTTLGKAFLRFESALGTAWCTDQRESATTASMKRDWGRADAARLAFKQELRLALDRFRAEGVEAERKRVADRSPTATGEGRDLKAELEIAEWIAGINPEDDEPERRKTIIAAARAQGEREGIEKAAQYHNARGQLVARSSAYQKAWHEMAAKDVRALATPEPQEDM